MAEFNPAISTNLGDNYTTRSQGSTPNKGLGLLFEALAGTVTDFKKQQAKAADTAIENAVTKGVDSLAEESLIPNATKTRRVGGAGSDANNFETQVLPDALESGAQTLSSMRQAYLQGKMNPVLYQMKVSQLSKSLRSQFPQYDSKIDSMLQTKLNASTANDMRKELNKLFDQEASTASDEDKRKKQFLKDHEGFLADPEVLTDYRKMTGKNFNPEDFDENAFMFATSNRKVRDANTQRRKDELALFQGEASDKETKAIQYATKDALQLKNSLVYTALNAEGLYDRLDLNSRLSKGSSMSPDDQQAVRDIVGRMRLSVDQAAENLLTGTDAQGRSYAQYITDPQKRDNIKRILTAPLDNLENALINKETGILNATKNSVEALKLNQENAYIQKDNGADKALATVIQKHGSTVINEYFNATEEEIKTYTPIQKALRQKIALELMSGRPVSEVFNELDVTGSVDPKDTKAVTAAVEDSVKFITSPETSKQKAAEIAGTALFSEDGKKVLEKYARTNPNSLFKTFVSPEMTEKLKGTPAWDEYSKFAYYQAGAVLKPVSDTIVDAQTLTDGANISYDEKTKRFTFVDKSIRLPGIPSLAAIWDSYNTNKGQTAVTTMNNYLDRIQPILDANGDNTEVFLQSFFMSDKYKDMEKQGGLMNRMSKALSGWITIRKSEDMRGTEPPKRALEGGFAAPSWRVSEDETPDSPILRFISKAEGAGYNTLFGGGETDLSSMTVGEVLNMQKDNSKSKGSSATGAIQVMRGTLQDLIKMGVVRTSEKFTPQLQDRIGHALLEKRGYSKFISGEMDIEDFADSLAKEWASFPTREGKSYYDKDGVNKATISREDFIKQLELLRQ